MTPSEANSDRDQIEQAIAAQESLRGVVDDTIIEASIATLKEKLAALDSPPAQNSASWPPSSSWTSPGIPP